MPRLLSAAPEAVETRARPDEASARTQLDNYPARTPEPREQPAGASTDLSHARDTSAIEPGSPKRSPLVFVLPAVAVLAIVGAVIGFSRVGEPAAPVDKDTATSTPPSAATALPPVEPTGTTAATATPAPSAVADAAPSATVASTVKAPAVKAPAVKTPATPPGPGPKPNVLDTSIKQ
jgi:hypothetical protein